MYYVSHCMITINHPVYPCLGEPSTGWIRSVHDQGYVQGAMPPHHDFLTGGDHLTGGAEP